MTRIVSRRTILKTLGLGAGFLPLLQSERAPAATSNGFPKRLITITWTDGIVPTSFYPQGDAGPLTTLPQILDPLQQWSSKVVCFRSADNQTSPIDLTCMLDNNGTYGGHFSYPSVLTGFNGGGGPSIDQIISDNLRQTQNVANAQLNIGCRPGGSPRVGELLVKKDPVQTDPYKLFNNLFTGQSMPPAQVNQLLQRRKSVLDFAAGELTRMSANLGSDDRTKIQAHFDSIRQLESQLEGTPSTLSCSPPSLTPAGVDFKNINNYPTHVQFMSDITAAAIACDKARAVTVDLIDDGGGNSLTFPWLGLASPDYHAIAHEGKAAFTQKAQIDRWFYQQSVARLVSKLAATPEGDKTALDNTAILVTNDMNEGWNHFVGSIPYVLIGSCGGFFKTGRLVTLPKSVPNNHLLTTLCHAMDVQIDHVGDPKYAGNLDSVLQS